MLTKKYIYLNIIGIAIFIIILSSIFLIHYNINKQSTHEAGLTDYDASFCESIEDTENHSNIKVTTTIETTKEITAPITEKPTVAKIHTTIQTTKAKTTTEQVESPCDTYDRTYEDNNASYIWNYMKQQGWNDAVCAGIMGNIMAEVGGHTLDIDPYLVGSGTYYGICQWSSYYYPDVWGSSLDYQLNYLVNTIRYEMNTYGYNYYSGFGYESFLNMTDCQEAARAFAMCYERCGGGYSTRAYNAQIAYDNFV